MLISAESSLKNKLTSPIRTSFSFNFINLISSKKRNQIKRSIHIKDFRVYLCADYLFPIPADTSILLPKNKVLFLLILAIQCIVTIYYTLQHVLFDMESNLSDYSQSKSQVYNFPSKFYFYYDCIRV